MPKSAPGCAPTVHVHFHGLYLHRSATLMGHSTGTESIKERGPLRVQFPDGWKHISNTKTQAWLRRTNESEQFLKKVLKELNPLRKSREHTRWVLQANCVRQTHYFIAWFCIHSNVCRRPNINTCLFKYDTRRSIHQTVFVCKAGSTPTSRGRGNYHQTHAGAFTAAKPLDWAPISYWSPNVHVSPCTSARHSQWLTRCRSSSFTCR